MSIAFGLIMFVSGCLMMRYDMVVISKREVPNWNGGLGFFGLFLIFTSPVIGVASFFPT